MIQNLLAPFDYDYMQKAIWVSALIGGICGLLSCFLTLKGWSLMGDALSHSIIPGVVVAYGLGIPFAIGAFVAGLLAAGSMGWIKEQISIRDDAIIGVVFTTFFALGLLLISLYPSPINLKTIVFGNILGISDEDVRQLLWISGICLLVLTLLWKDLFLWCFDPIQARVMGFPVRFLKFTLLALLTLTSVAALQTVGVCLVVAMLVTPGATAYLLTDRFGVMMVLSFILGAVTSFCGAYASYYLDGSVGGSIVVLQTILFLTVWIFAPKHGVLAMRRLVVHATSEEVKVI
jgi:manganese/iron transport system permease protein